MIDLHEAEKKYIRMMQEEDQVSSVSCSSAAVYAAKPGDDPSMLPQSRRGGFARSRLRIGVCIAPSIVALWPWRAP